MDQGHFSLEEASIAAFDLPRSVKAGVSIMVRNKKQDTFFIVVKYNP